jgi:uncharacterized protein (DUF2062 family)
MIHLTRALIRRWLDELLHVDDTPSRTAAAFALGVLFGFSPLLGLHTVLGIAVAFLLNLNRVSVLLGVYSNLPWFIAPYYATATWLGAKLTRAEVPVGFAEQLRKQFELSLLHREFWVRLAALVHPLIVPYAVGATIGAVLLAAVAYPLALAFVTSERRLQKLIHHHHHQP